ncbi:hypothetical protein ACTNEY_14520 [Fusicatenibacter saccharivorans]|uniref:hypothetical protein n=1 Tax=Fusicatenibacter saccharivorans TaxID=1150298 RepID=UPI003F8CCF25
MSKRNIEKHILMNKAEAQDLQKKAKRACLSEGGLIRLILCQEKVQIKNDFFPSCQHT